MELRMNGSSSSRPVTVLLPELFYLAFDHLSHMGQHIHVRRIKHAHDELLRCRHRSIQIDNELFHGHVAVYINKKELVTSLNYDQKFFLEREEIYTIKVETI